MNFLNDFGGLFSGTDCYFYSIEESGKIVYLNSDLVQYEEYHTVADKTNTYKYHILGKLDSGSIINSSLAFSCFLENIGVCYIVGGE